MASSKVALRFSKSRGWEDVVPAWEGPVAVGAQTPPLGTGPVVTVAALVTALDALAAQQNQQQQQQQQDVDPFPDFLKDYAPSCGGGGAAISCGTSSNDFTGLTLENLETSSEGGDFSRVCMVSSSHDAQDEWDTATIVEDMLTEGIPQLEFEDSDISSSTSSSAAADSSTRALSSSSSPTTATTELITSPSPQSRSVLVAWQDASDNMMRNVRLFLGPLAQSQELWSSWGLRIEDWPTFNHSVNQDPEETDAHVSSLIQAVQNAIQADQTSSPDLHIHENQDMVVVVRSIHLRPSASLELLIHGYAEPLVAMVQSGLCCSPNFWSQTFMIDAQSEEESRLHQAAMNEVNGTGNGLSVIYDFLLGYLTRASIRHWSEEALVNGLRVTIYPHEATASEDQDLDSDAFTFTRSMSVNSLTGGVLGSPTTATSTTAHGDVEDNSATSKVDDHSLELDLEHLFGTCGFISSEEEGGSDSVTLPTTTDDDDLPPTVGKVRGKQLAQLASSLDKKIMKEDQDQKMAMDATAAVDYEGDRPHWRKARASRVKYYESEESEVNDDEEEEEGEEISNDDADDEEFIPSRRSSTTSSRRPRADSNASSSTIFTIGSKAPAEPQQKKKAVAPKKTAASSSSNGALIHPPYDYPGRPTPVGKDLPDRGRHKCRIPGCTEDYRWPDYFCKIHGGGKCQYFWWDDSVETCSKFHQSKNSNGELLCGEHCRATGARYGEMTRKAGKASGGGGGGASSFSSNTTKKRKRAIKKKVL